MPRIVITTELAGTGRSEVLLDERVLTSDLASDRGSAQLIERIGWALLDADSAELRPARR